MSLNITKTEQGWPIYDTEKMSRSACLEIEHNSKDVAKTENRKAITLLAIGAGAATALTLLAGLVVEVVAQASWIVMVSEFSDFAFYGLFGATLLSGPVIFGVGAFLIKKYLVDSAVEAWNKSNHFQEQAMKCGQQAASLIKA